MFEYFKSMITIPADEEDSSQKKLQIATCALFYEMAKADEDLSGDEHEMIVSIMKDLHQL